MSRRLSLDMGHSLSKDPMSEDNVGLLRSITKSQHLFINGAGVLMKPTSAIPSISCKQVGDAHKKVVSESVRISGYSFESKPSILNRSTADRIAKCEPPNRRIEYDLDNLNLNQKKMTCSSLFEALNIETGVMPFVHDTEVVGENLCFREEKKQGGAMANDNRSMSNLQDQSGELPGFPAYVKKCRVKYPLHHLDAPDPRKWVYIEISCPRAANCKCKGVSKRWSCSTCDGDIAWDFSKYFFCICGVGHLRNYVFQCEFSKQGEAFLQYPMAKLNAALQTLRHAKDDVNILVLGETGVGKSTWINAIANYLTYSDVVEAMKNEMICWIPSQFTITDHDLNTTQVQVGVQDKNENFETGHSATQFPKAYTMHTCGRLIRIIDTPGIGDTRGYEKDKENFENILQFISPFDKLHAICILLKPNNAKLNVTFRFCVKELLCHLHQSAASNLLFCYTNARSTSYRPGDTHPILHKLLQSINCGIHLGLDTVYCLDNEAFRFLAEHKQGIQHDETEISIYAASWVKSVKETSRLMGQILKLQPHLTKDTTSLNQARNTVLHASTPLAELTKAIAVNLQRMEQHKTDIASCSGTIQELKDKLYVPVITYRQIEMSYPMTVCTSTKCSIFVKSGAIMVRKPNIQCHPHCYLDNVETNVINNNKLLHCAAMSNGVCLQCGCGWKEHMHIVYELEEVELKVVDKDTETLLNSTSSQKVLKETGIKKMNQEIELLESEKKMVMHKCAKLGGFLKENAITPYNDAIRDYLGHLIREERECVNLGGEERRLQFLQKALREYDEEVRVLDIAMNSGSESFNSLQPEQIPAVLEEIYRLPKCSVMMQKRSVQTRSGRAGRPEDCYVPTPSRKSLGRRCFDRARSFLPFY